MHGDVHPDPAADRDPDSHARPDRVSAPDAHPDPHRLAELLVTHPSTPPRLRQ